MGVSSQRSFPDCGLLWFYESIQLSATEYRVVLFQPRLPGADMSECAVAGLLLILMAGVFVLSLVRASARREIAWERLRRQTCLQHLTAKSYE